MIFRKYILGLLLLLTASLPATAQIQGVVIDAQTGDTISYPSATYKGHHIAVSGDASGKFTIDRHEGWILTISAVGYQSKEYTIKPGSTAFLNVKLKSDTRTLKGVVVKSKRNRYSRKDNPAVELMRRVIAAKKKTDLNNHAFYQYNKYQKITMAVNDIQPVDIDSGFFANKQWLIDQIETSPYNHKLILPLSVDETVTQHLYRKNPKTEKDIILGQQTNGINQLFETGDILNTVMKDVFTDVDLYDDQVRLLQYPSAVLAQQPAGLWLPRRAIYSGRLHTSFEKMRLLNTSAKRC